MDKKIDTLLVVFSATSIHGGLAMQALDLAEQNNAKLIILSVRDKNVAEKVAKITKNHGFLGEKVVNELKKDILKDRDEVISRRLGAVEKEAKTRSINFETVQVKGNLVENVVNVVEKYSVDVILLEDISNILERIKKNINCEVLCSS